MEWQLRRAPINPDQEGREVMDAAPLIIVERRGAN
jgi:hypothetical protein